MATPYDLVHKFDRVGWQKNFTYVVVKVKGFGDLSNKTETEKYFHLFYNLQDEIKICHINFHKFCNCRRDGLIVALLTAKGW